MSELTLQNLTLSNELAELKTNKEFMQEEMECVRQEKDENATEKEILSKKHEEALLKIKKLEQLDQETKEQLEKVTELVSLFVHTLPNISREKWYCWKPGRLVSYT